ncbi:MAG: TRAP transporter substrate-binding protein [Thermodesulfobacteriota bacterium]
MAKRRLVTPMLGLFVMLTLVLASGGPCQAQKPIDLRISTWGGPKHYMSVGYWNKLFIPTVEKASNGRVKCAFFPGAVLGKAPDHYDMAVTGIADLTWSIISYTPGRFPLIEVLTLPFIAPGDGVLNSKVLWDLYAEFPEVSNPFKDTHVVLFYAIPPDIFHSPKQPFNKLDDFRGKKIRGPSNAVADVIKSFGGAPIQMPITEVYQAASSGILDGWISAAGTLKGFKLAETAKYSYLPGWSCSLFFVTMNLSKWNSLPKEIQDLITEKLGGKVGAEWCGRLGDQDQRDGIQYTKELKNQVITWSPEMVEQLKKASRPVHEAWIKEMEAKGLPGKKVYNRALELLEKYKK